MREPVIIFGMHRSGTTLVVELLRRLGFFPGARLEENLEPWFFLRRNEWLLRRAGGAWDHPTPMARLLEDDRFCSEAAELMASEVQHRFFEFTGVRARRKRERLLSEPWGFKDPRSTFTLPVWLRVFPRARLLCVHRHGVDVASSLHLRATRDDPRRSVLDIRPMRSRIKASLRRFELLGHYSESARCQSLQGAFQLWEEYVTQAEAVLEGHPGPKHRVSFERLVREPHSELTAIAELAGLEADEASILGACAGIRADRAFAFASDPKRMALWREVRSSECLKLLSYDQEPGEA